MKVQFERKMEEKFMKGGKNAGKRQENLKENYER